jgi:hypothetical protein
LQSKNAKLIPTMNPALALALLKRQQTIHATSGSDAPHRALAELCHMLLSSNGFIHLD